MSLPENTRLSLKYMYMYLIVCRLSSATCKTLLRGLTDLSMKIEPVLDVGHGGGQL